MVMAELPDDVIKAILLWLPVKSLIRFKCVDKSWCALIGNPYFMEQHRTHSALRPDATHLLLSYGGKYFPYSIQTIFTATTNGGAPSPIPPNILEHEPFHLSCCHGLISMHPRDNVKGNTFVYNPNTRETLSIPFNANAFKDYIPVRSFIGFEPVSNQYKLMILSNKYKRPAYISTHCEIIILGGTDNNWRQVVVNKTTPVPYGHSTCLNGALHWRDFDRQNVVVFDLKSHKFGTILGPKRMQESRFKLCQVRGCLTLVESSSESYHPEASFELWTLKDYSSGVWVKQSFNFFVPRDLLSTVRYHVNNDNRRVVGGMNNDEILISLGLDQLFGYNMETKIGRKIDVRVEHQETKLDQNVMLYTDSMRCY